MKGLLAIALIVAACGGATTSSVPSAPAPSADLTATPSASNAADQFTAAVARMGRARPDRSSMDPEDWTAAQLRLRKLADAYEMFGLDLERIDLPDVKASALPSNVTAVGDVTGLRSHAAALIGWSKELAIALRQIAAADSFDAGMQGSVEFEGSTYPMATFIQEGTGEWGAALGLTADALGVDLTGDTP